MSGFTQHIDSPFPDANMLFDPAKAMQTAQSLQNNQLLMQGRQLDLSNANMEQVARASAGLLSAYPDEASRAAAYPRVVGMLQSQGFAQHAPAQYPGEATLRQLVQMGTPSEKQAEWLANIQANKVYSGATNPTAAAPAGATAAPGASPLAIPARGTGGPGASASAPTAWLPYFEEASKETGIPVDLLIAQARQESSFDPNAKGTAGEIGLFQIKPSTAAAPAGMAGVDPASITGPDNVRNNILFGARYLKAQMGGGDPNNPAVQAAALRRYNGVGPGGDPDYVAHVFGYRPTLAPSDPNAAVTTYTPGGGTQTATAPTGGVAARTGGVDTAGPGAPTAAPDAVWDLPGAPAPDQPPQPPTNQFAPGGVNGPPVAVPQPTATAPPAGGPQPPQLQPINSNGLTPLQQAQIDAVAGTGRVTVQQRMAAEQAFRNQNIQLNQKAFSDWVQLQTLQTSQGQLSVSQANSALEYWKAAHPDAKVTMTGGEIVTQDPRTGQEIAPRIQVTPQRADTAAMAIVSRLGPKVANRTATPDEEAQYAVAVDSYRQPVLRENPVTKETVRVNTRELPAGFPEPPSLGSSGAPGGATPPGGAQTVMPGLSPAQQQVERDPAAYKVAESQYERNAKEVPAISDAVRQSQADQVRIREMQDVLQKFNSGRGTEAAMAAKAWINSWAPAALTGWQKESANLSGSQAAEAFSKLALVGAGTQERSVLGARGGYQAIKLFKEANPNINLQDATNKSILDMQLISNQANTDYAQAALSHFADNEKKFAATHQYDSLEQFDRNWNSQRNPQVYSAAMGAISGQQASQWAKGLSDDEYARALQIVQRAKPSTVVQTKNGPYSLEPNAVTTGAATTPGNKVIRFDHNGNVIQ